MPRYEFTQDVMLNAGPRARVKFKAGAVEMITTAQAREADEKGAGHRIGEERSSAAPEETVGKSGRKRS